jgi:hypothetical protein
MRPGDEVVWYKSDRHGGKYAVVGVFVEYTGKASARIAIGERQFTVRIRSLRAK